MHQRLRVFADGGNRLTKIMEESKKPFSFPTIISEPGVELNYDVNFNLFDLDPEVSKLEKDSILVEVIKDGKSLGKKLVGKAAENKGVIIKDKNRYKNKSEDEVIYYSILVGVAYNLVKTGKSDVAIDLTVNQPLVEYVANNREYINKYANELKGNVKVSFFNLFNINEEIEKVAFNIEAITFCPEAIATYFQYAVNEDGSLNNRSSKKTIVCDIGSGQINIAAFDSLKTAGVNTFEKGMLDCYEKISMILYNNYRNQLDRKPFTYDVDNMIRFQDKKLKVKKGIDIDVSDIVHNVFDGFAYELNKDFREFVKSKFIGNCDEVIFCGGGSEILFPYLIKYLDEDFVCTKNETKEYHNVIGSMYYRIYKDNAKKSI